MSFSSHLFVRWAVVLLLLLWISPDVYAQNVGINGDGSNPESNTMLDIKSTGNTSATFGLKVKDSGANDQFVVRSDGNVGIGLSTPLSPVHVYAPSWDAIRVERAGIGDSWSWTLDAIRMHFMNRGNEEAILTLSKNRHVGINWTAPIGALEVRADKDLVLDSAFTFTDAGYMGIGTRNAKNKLDVEGGAVIGATYSGTNTAPSNGLLVEGNIGIGTATPAFKLDVNGTTACTGNVWTSDERKKKDIIPLAIEGLATIERLQPVSYQWKEVIDDGMKGTQMGFIAQDIEEILPSMVVTANDSIGSKAVKYNEMLPILVQAIQEQQMIIEEQYTEIGALKTELTATKVAMERRLEQLEEHIKTADK